MSCFDWLDMGTFLNEVFGFPVSRFLGKPLNAFFFLLFPSFLFSSSFLRFLHFCASSFLRAQVALLFPPQV